LGWKCLQKNDMGKTKMFSTLGLLTKEELKKKMFEHWLLMPWPNTDVCVCVCEWVRERMLNAWLIINHTNSAVQWAPNCMVVLFNVIKKERFCCNNWMLPCGGFSPTGHSPDSDPDACTAPWGASNTFLSWNPAWCAPLWFLVDQCFYQEHTINSNSLQCGVFALVFWSSFKVPLGKCGYN
jgi:hypothetical protein